MINVFVLFFFVFCLGPWGACPEVGGWSCPGEAREKKKKKRKKKKRVGSGKKIWEQAKISSKLWGQIKLISQKNRFTREKWNNKPKR
jgi:hypothetical protein